MRTTLVAAITAFAAIPGTALAGKVVLPPLIADATVDDGQRAGIHQLIASELDFHPAVTGVVPVGQAVAPNLDCLDSAACLKAVALANGGDQLLAGTLTGGVDGGLSLELVWFDGAQVATRKSFSVPRESTALANAMTPILQEILGGKAAGASAPTAEDFAVDDEDDVPMLVAPVALAPTPAPPPPPPPAPVAAAPPPAPAPVAVATGPTLTPSARRMASASAATGLGQAKLPAAPATREPLAYTRRHPVDLDTPATTRARSSGGGGGGEELDHLLQITVLGGAAVYGARTFGTTGLELAVDVFQGLHVQAGGGVYIGKAPLPLEVQVETLKYAQTAWFYPYHLGAKYVFSNRRLQPYASADFVAAQYAAGAWAAGGRVRGGADLMISDHFGFDANLGLGYWSGRAWSTTWGTTNAGVVPQISLGTVFAF